MYSRVLFTMSLFALSVIYSKFPLDIYPDSILSYARAFGALVPSRGFRRLRIFAGSQDQGEYLPWNEASLQLIESDMLAKRLHSFLAEDRIRRIKGQEPHLVFEAVVDAVARLGDVEAMSATVNLVSSWIDCAVFDKSNGNDVLSKWLDVNTRAWLDTKSSYGYVLVSDLTWERIWAVAHGIDMHFLHDEYTQDVRVWKQNYRHMDTHVRGAYWGNFFNNEHLARLGGRSQVRSQPFWRIWIDLPQGGFGAISASPVEFVTPEVQIRLQELHAFLKPILMPQHGSLDEVSWSHLREEERIFQAYRNREPTVKPK